MDTESLVMKNLDDNVIGVAHQPCGCDSARQKKPDLILADIKLADGPPASMRSTSC